eukprot:Skav219160  [mRNA]  locus=scaffold648:69607:71643:- [translate_table: standard]
MGSENGEEDLETLPAVVSVIALHLRTFSCKLWTWYPCKRLAPDDEHISVSLGVDLEIDGCTADAVQELKRQRVASSQSSGKPSVQVRVRNSTAVIRSTLRNVVDVHTLRGTNWSAAAQDQWAGAAGLSWRVGSARRAADPQPAQDSADFSQFFGGLAAEGAFMAGLSVWRMVQTLLTVVLSSVIVAIFFATSLVLSGIWAVPGHEEATFGKGFMNRIAWALSPVFLGGFFPGLCNPSMMLNWRIHRYFIVISLLPFIIADVAFPYVVGTDSHFKVSCAILVFTCMCLLC